MSDNTFSQPTNVVFESTVTGLERIHRGKVRDLYAIDDDHMLIVATDRISAFDVILPDPMPSKGYVLTQVSNFWFAQTKHIVPNHLADLSVSDVVPSPEDRKALEGRAVVVKRLNALPIEAVVRGYLIGSGWKDYKATGAVCGIKLPQGMQLAEKLETPMYTPATKAAVGEHDENISYQSTVDLLGEKVARSVRDTTLALYAFAADYARNKGIIIADTKFEFGLDKNETLTLIDEALTPDSSRFWDKDHYSAGSSPSSFDKQIVRDYLDNLDWDKTAPGPSLPDEILQKTGLKYQQVLSMLTA
ncbi:MAG: phosphoribosylaminoimidazolesuccinocarboxamide synthase [Pseudomonadota bacterium]